MSRSLEAAQLAPLDFQEPDLDVEGLLGECRRGAQRLPVRGFALTWTADQNDERTGEPVECLAKDLSPRGIGLMMSSPLNRGTRLIVEFAYVHRNECRRVAKLGRVAHSSPLIGQWRVGVEFLADA